jgi:predicted O-methyltransferase YrrM
MVSEGLTVSANKPSNAATYRKAALDLAAQFQPRVLVEVGVYAGALSKMFATLACIERQVIVDSWEAGYSKYDRAHMDAIAQSVFAWASFEPRVEVMRMRSVEAASRFEDGSVDFFHTDGDHSLQGITGDISAWLPKVRRGGILSGDNYEALTVAAGVDALLPHRELLANGRLWWARK